MTDIVERLKEPMPRHLFFPLADALCMEAADEITRLRQLLSEAETCERRLKGARHWPLPQHPQSRMVTKSKE